VAPRSLVELYDDSLVSELNGTDRPNPVSHLGGILGLSVRVSRHALDPMALAVPAARVA
jgi:hypothetical protein